MKTKFFVFSILFSVLLVSQAYTKNIEDVKRGNFLLKFEDRVSIISNEVEKQKIFAKITEEAGIIIEFPRIVGEELYSACITNIKPEDFFQRIIADNFVLFYNSKTICKVSIYRKNEASLLSSEVGKKMSAIKKTASDIGSEREIFGANSQIAEARKYIQGYKLEQAITLSDNFLANRQGIAEKVNSEELEPGEASNIELRNNKKYKEELKLILNPEEFNFLFGD